MFLIDYANERSINKGFTDALEYTGGQLDVLFNNGAYGIPALRLRICQHPRFEPSFETNFFGWHTLSRLAIAQMRKQNEGRIIQNSSVLGFAPLKFRGAYNATKFALEGLTDTMRLELDQTNIHLILIEPGPHQDQKRLEKTPTNNSNAGSSGRGPQAMRLGVKRWRYPVCQ